MHQFLPDALGLLQKYRSSLKKQLSKEEHQESLTKLKLHDLPRDEVNVYRLLKSVADHLREQVQEKFKHVRFSGKKRFLQDMQNLLDWYRLEKGKVVHASKEASCAVLLAIQLMTLSGENYTKKLATQLDQQALKVARYGLKEQHLAFWNSLKEFAKQDESFFSPLISRYQEYLKKHSGIEVLEELLKQSRLD